MGSNGSGKLTAMFVERHRIPGTYNDGGGLYLQVSSPTAKSWVFRYWDGRRTREKGYAIHVRHPLVGQQKRNSIIAHLQALQQVERTFRGVAADHAVLSTVLRAQVAFDGPQNVGIVVHGKQNGLRHSLVKPWGIKDAGQTKPDSPD